VPRRRRRRAGRRSAVEPGGFRSAR
jgi:hypothetical protein